MNKNVKTVSALLAVAVINGTFAFKCARYSVKRNIAFPENIEAYSNREVPALTVCGSLCLHDDNCTSAVYNESDKQCSLFNQALECLVDGNTGLVHIRKHAEDSCDAEVHDSGVVPSVWSIYDDCQDVYEHGIATEGVYQIRGYSETISVLCKFWDSKGWTVIQQRMDGSENFLRVWSDYVAGFGGVTGEHWLGLDNIHHLTTTKGNQKLHVLLGNHEGEFGYAEYSPFYIDSGGDQYTAHVSGYSGNAGDSMQLCDGQPFTTSDLGGCAATYKGAWWFVSCHNSHLNGQWYADSSSASNAQGLIWKHWTGYGYSLKEDVMAVTRC